MSNEQHSTIAPGLRLHQKCIKRAFDLAIAVPGFILTLPLICVAVLGATIDTRKWGIFTQERVGRGGVLFKVHKVRSMRNSPTIRTTVTSSSDPRITKLGALLRRTKLDELTQLWDVVSGNMSLVGPRPDVEGWADKLEGADRIILSVRPGITGPASLHFKNEESLLSSVEDPVEYNSTVIWPEKITLNKEYVENWSLSTDIRIIAKTIFDR